MAASSLMTIVLVNICSFSAAAVWRTYALDGCRLRFAPPEAPQGSREKPSSGLTPVSEMLASFHRYVVWKERKRKQKRANR